MKKSNLVMQAAVAALFAAVSVSSFAGTAAATAAPMAAQVVVSNTTAINSAAVTYTTAAVLPIGTNLVKVTLGGGAKFTQAAGATLAAGTLTTLAANTTVAAGTVSADQTFVTYPVTTTAAVVVGATLVFKPTDLTALNGAINNAGFLATVGANLPVTMSIGASAVAPADIDTAATINAITSVNGVTFTAAASAEARKIDVLTGAATALTPGATITSPSLVNFGTFTLAATAGALNTDAATAYTLAGNNTATFNAVLTGNFAAAQGTGGKVFLASNATCVTPITAGTAVVAGTTATFTGVAVTAAAAGATQPNVCMQVNTPNNAVTIKPTLPSLVATVAGLNGLTSAFTSAAASLYNLTFNGSANLVKTYIPAGAAGYTSFIRVINTSGAVSKVQASVVDQTTGVTAQPAVLIPALAAGAAVTLTSAQIEAAIGAVTDTTTRPTLQITAPATLTVQSFILTNANGNFAEVSGAE